MNSCSLILLLWLSAFSGNTLYTAEGRASYYSDRLHGQRTANGERYDKNELTAAHATLPFDTRVQVTNTRNGKTVVVRINDRMARSRHRLIDLSKAAALKLDIVRSGYGPVRLAEVKSIEAEQQEPALPVSEADHKN